MPSRRKTWQGVVVGDKMSKTLVVEVSRRFTHRRFHKVIERSSTFYVHDPKGEGKMGEIIEFEVCRPLSKIKRWRLLRVLKVQKRKEAITLSDVPSDVLIAKKKVEEMPVLGMEADAGSVESVGEKSDSTRK